MSQHAISPTKSPTTSFDDALISTRRSTRSLGQVLAVMTFAERVRAYESGVFTRSELAKAVACEPECLPTINGEFEWIGCSLADNLD